MLEEFQKLAERKRAELEGAIERGEVHDPISALFTIATLKLIAISTAVSAASYLVSRAFQPKAAKQEFGRLQGTLQLQNSEQGIMIPEIYGGSPTADKMLGGIKIPAIIVWSSGIRKNTTITQQPRRGGKGGGGGQGAGTIENFSYDIDLGMMWCRGPVNLLRLYGNADILVDQTAANPTGLYDPTVGADAPYDPFEPPDPNTDYSIPVDRWNETMAFDGNGVGSGTIQAGSSLFAVYPGNDTQDPDPTIEADIDAQYGAGSTPAYRGHSLIVEKTFDLSRWGGIVPNQTAVFEHQDLLTLDDIFASFCERVNVLAANGDHDFTGLSTIACRGMLIAGRLFSPAEVIGSPGIQVVYNYFITEPEGQIVGIIEGDEPTVTIADTEIGWMDADSDVGDILPEVDTVIASEIELARQIDIKYLQLGEGDWDPSTQSDNRQITEGVSTQVLEVQLALTADEAREAAQRKLYRDYVGGSVHKFTLPWTYLYLYPGYKITITRAEGFSHVLKLTSITGGIGILECEGVALEPAAFVQPAVGAVGPGYQPPQSIPAMTILTLLDTPLLRDGDETENNGVGFYMCGTPRTGVDQSWRGFVLYQEKNNNWTPIADSNLPGTIGRIVSATTLNTADTSVFDRTGVFVVDLYGTTAALSSITEADVLADATRNLALFGSMVCQFVTATQVGGFPNRWSLSTLLNGQRGTESHITDTFTDARFVLIDQAVKFVPTQIADIDGLFDYRAPTVGQSFADAATVEFVWAGGTLECNSPVNIRGTRNADGDLFQEWTRRTRYASGMIPGSDVPLGEEVEMYDVEVLTTGDVLKRTMRVSPGGAQAAILIPYDHQFVPFVSGNNLLASGGALNPVAFTQQSLTNSGSWVEATLQLTTTNDTVFIILAQREELYNSVTGLTNYHQIRFSNTSGVATVEIYSKASDGISVLLYTSPDYPGLSSARVRVAVSGSEVRYYWDYLGPGTIPMFVTPTPATLPLVAQFNAIGDGAKASNIFVGNNITGPSVIYSALQQTEDGFTPNVSTIRTRVYQISSIVGRGRVGQEDL